MLIRKLAVTGVLSAAQRGARAPSMPVAKRLDVMPAVLDIENAAEDDDLAVEPAPEIILVVLDGARTQIGKGEGRNVVGAALEIQRHRVRHPAGNAVAGKRQPAALIEFGRGAERPRRQFDRHRGTFAPLTVKLSGRRRTMSSLSI